MRSLVMALKASATAMMRPPSGIDAAHESVRIAAAVPAFVVVADDLGDVRHGIVDFQDRGADLAVAAHLRHLRLGQASRLEQDGVGDADLADVVQIAADADRHLLVLVEAEDRGHSFGQDPELPAMLARLEVAGLDGRRKRQGDRVEHRAQVSVLQRLVAHLRRRQGAPDLRQKLLTGERLDEHSRRTLAQRLDCRVDRAVPGHHHDRQFRLNGPQCAHQGQAVHSRHVDVGDDDVEGSLDEVVDGG